jgi:hypothetical protein
MNSDQVLFHLVVFGAVDVDHVAGGIGDVGDVLAVLGGQIQMIHGPVGGGEGVARS